LQNKINQLEEALKAKSNWVLLSKVPPLMKLGG
jgi:hypothetical protein